MCAMTSGNLVVAIVFEFKSDSKDVHNENQKLVQRKTRVSVSNGSSWEVFVVKRYPKIVTNHGLRLYLVNFIEAINRTMLQLIRHKLTRAHTNKR